MSAYPLYVFDAFRHQDIFFQPGKYQQRITLDLENLPPAIAQLQALGDIGEHPRFARLGRRLAEGFSADAKVDLSGLADTESPFALNLDEKGNIGNL